MTQGSELTLDHETLVGNRKEGDAIPANKRKGWRSLPGSRRPHETYLLPSAKPCVLCGVSARRFHLDRQAGAASLSDQVDGAAAGSCASQFETTAFQELCYLKLLTPAVSVVGSHAFDPLSVTCALART